MLLSLPFIIGSFLLLGYSCVHYIKTGRLKSLAIYSLGSISYFSLIWLLWVIASTEKPKYSATIEDFSFVAQMKREDLLRKREYGGILAYLNPNFLPTKFNFDPLWLLREPKKGVRKQKMLCYICFLEEANAFSSTCGHGGLCSFCAETIHNFRRGCPICAKEIEEVAIYKEERGDFVTVDTIRNIQ